MKRPYWILLLVTLSGVLAAAYAIFVEPGHIVVERQTMAVRGCHQEIVLAQLSDLHIGSVSDAFLQSTLDLLAEQKPDILLLTGDLLTSSRLFEKVGTPVFDREFERLDSWLKHLHAPLGVFAVRGNHDFSDDKELSDLFLDLLRNRGIMVLTNQRTVIPIDGGSLYLLGVDYSGFAAEVVAKFPVRLDDRSRFIRSGPSRKNSYTHYYPEQDSLWHDYSYTVKFRLSEPPVTTVGFNVYSQFHLGYDRFYRLRWFGEEQRFRFSPHGTRIVEDLSQAAMILEPATWYYAKVTVATERQRTQMHAKIWRADAAEPNRWQISAWDSSASRLQSGTVGLFTNLRGMHEFDELLVARADGDTLLHQDMENIQDGFKPPRWVDFNWDLQAIPMLAEGLADTCLTVLLSHNPGSIKQAAQAHIDLQLSGHTHGGQIYLPPLGAPWAMTDNSIEYVRGRHKVGSTILYINRGLGSTFLPIRFLSPPEITIIRLKPARAPRG